MTASEHTYRLWPIVVALILVSFNLRPILAAIGPLLDEIQHTTGLGSALAGLLTTLPVFAMGWVRCLAPGFRHCSVSARAL
ncbi:hypothetical protein ACFQDN_25430 [Pseudomonas asuensis]